MAFSWTLPGALDRDELIAHAQDAIPSHFGRAARELEDLEAFAEMIAVAAGVVSDWQRSTYIDNADARWLNVHADDRGTRRQSGESLGELRLRLKVPADVVTPPVILARSDALLASAGVAGTTVGAEGHDLGAFFFDTPGTPADADGFGFLAADDGLAFGYRLLGRPAMFILFMPDDVDDGTILAITEDIRRHRAGGVESILEQPAWWTHNAATWEARLGFALTWATICDGGALPFENIVDPGTADVDDDVTPGASFTEPWPGMGGGTFAYLPDDDNVQIATTETAVWAPGTALWCVLIAFKRSDEDVSASNHGIFGTGAADEGISMMERNSVAQNWIFGKGEDQDNTSHSLIITDGPPLESICYAAFSRTSATRLDLWVREEGADEVFHEDETIDAADEFNGATVLEMLYIATVGGLEGGGGVKALLYGEGPSAIGSTDVLDVFSRTATTEVTEA